MRNSSIQAIAKASLALILLGSAAAVGAQNATTGTTGTGSTENSNTGSSTTSSGTTTPGTPNTGAGGDMGLNLSVLGASAVIAVLGASIMTRRRLS